MEGNLNDTAELGELLGSVLLNVGNAFKVGNQVLCNSLPRFEPFDQLKKQQSASARVSEHEPNARTVSEGRSSASTKLALRYDKCGNYCDEPTGPVFSRRVMQISVS